MLEISRTMEFSPKRDNANYSSKPIQTGLQLTSKSLVSLHADMVVQNSKLKFLLPGCISQDSLENVFSQI